MNLIFNDEYSGKFISPEKKTTIKDEIGKAREVLYSREGAGSDFLGWIDHPVNYDKEEFGRISAAAEKIKKICDVFVVIGIGGSYLGARAALEFVKSPLYNQLPKDTPDIYFAGRDLSPASLSELLTLCEGKDICVNVISKSGTTTEPAIAFRVFRQLLEKKYGMDGAKERIFVTTDKVKGALKELANEKGYETFVVPDDIGGRYSVLSAVGLLPIAVAGIDIKEMMDGARAAREVYGSAPYEENDCLKYVAARNLLYRSGKAIEIFVTYDSALMLFAEWWKQLFGESEGKDGVSLYPSSVNFTTDLHSLGQYIQQGTRNIFETVLCIEDDSCSISVPADEDGRDGMNYLAGKTLSEINRTAMKATLLAHVDGGVPNLMISLKDRSAYTFGWAVYFFELACGISGYTLGVNPFNQPGVEDYKKNMYALLGKPGEENEARRKELLNRIK